MHQLLIHSVPVAQKTTVDHSAAIKYAFSNAPTNGAHLLVATTRRGICAVLLTPSTTLSGGADPTTEPLSLVPDLERRFKKSQKISKADFTDTDALSIAARENLELVQELLSVREPSEAAAALRGVLEAKLDLHGTQTQQKVWQALLKVPTGQTVTYAELAQQAGLDAKACRAVAQACGANHIGIIVPCHRAVPKSGGLGGYHWGVEIKQALLRSEGVAL